MENLIDLDSFKTALTERTIDVSAEGGAFNLRKIARVDISSGCWKSY